MKFVLVIAAYLMIGLILGWGILLTAKGNPWLLIAGFLAYSVAFARFGCLTKSKAESHHLRRGAAIARGRQSIGFCVRKTDKAKW